MQTANTSPLVARTTGLPGPFKWRNCFCILDSVLEGKADNLEVRILCLRSKNGATTDPKNFQEEHMHTKFQST